MSIVTWFLDLLYPPRCTICRKLLREKETDFCAECRTKLSILEAPIKRGEFFTQCYAVTAYSGDVAASLKRYKFQGMQQYAGAYGRLIAMQLLRMQAAFDILSWVPVSKKRRRKRGFDQSELLARTVANELGVSCVRTLEKVRDNPAQSLLEGAEQRRANVINAYRSVEPERFANRHVLLIDDIMTTGATLSECSRILLTAGAASVLCATVAVTQLSNN
ncbi:MAG: ComF family protein [Firmicutes bacterium]|nr:ComF family protein [Bacillota bacterium]